MAMDFITRIPIQDLQPILLLQKTGQTCLWDLTMHSVKKQLWYSLMSNTTSSSAGFNNGWEKSIRLKSQGGTGGVAAPKEMLDLFPMADGSRPTVTNGYDDTKFFMNRDPRFYRTFAFSGCKWGYKANTSASVWMYRYLKADGKTKVYANTSDNTIQSPAYVCKMSSQSADNTGFTYSGTDIYEYRYAELLLNIAECYAANGDVTNCRTYLGKDSCSCWYSSRY